MALEQILAALNDLVEGKLSEDQWEMWWSTNNERVEVELGRGDYLALKMANRDRHSATVKAQASQKAAHKILKKRDIESQFVCRFDDAVEQTLQDDSVIDAFCGKVILIALDDFAANVKPELMQRLCDECPSVADCSDDWIRRELTLAFKWIDHPPRWVGNPDWPTVEGVPAIFLSQFTICDSDVAKREYSADRTVYVFGYRSWKTRTSFELNHIVVSHSHHV